jgi:hypothetical protein
MGKTFAPNPANASRTETDAALYCSGLSTTVPRKLIYPGRNADRCKAMLFLLLMAYLKIF